MDEIQLKVKGQCFKINPETKEITQYAFENKTPNEIMEMKYEYTDNGYYKVMFDETVASTATWKYTFLEYDQYLMNFVSCHSQLFTGICYITRFFVVDNKVMTIYGVCEEDVKKGVMFD